MKPVQILLTNDDGIRSPGLWTAAAALSELGFVHVVAPRDQFSGAGRSMPISSDGLIAEQDLQVNEKSWKVYSVGGTPAQAVQHAVLEVLPVRPDLVVSGINYGENLGTGITISGTVGAALEAAALGLPALAVSLETGHEYHLSYSTDIDFTVAAHFARYFARRLLDRRMPEDVDVLKIDIPSVATLATPWEITRLSRTIYYEPLAPERASWDQPGRVGYRVVGDPGEDVTDSDVYAIRVKRVVSVTPLSLDMTSRVSFPRLAGLLRGE
ncbi:MAG TPA: 5'/3'-nucleotidase SurE [Anaerolineales bacterium]|nr:5'/3'-nucleotidase SurE [Anaerolineales bacterium]